MMADLTLLPDPTYLHLLQLEAAGKMITATVTTTVKDAQCPLCTHSSEKVHSRDVRVLADLPWVNCVVQLELHTRRFFCLNPGCQRKIFTERLPNVVAPYAHKTLLVNALRSGSGTSLVIQAHQQSILKTFTRSRSGFLISTHSSAIPESPKLCQNPEVSRFCPPTWIWPTFGDESSMNEQTES